MNLLNEPPRPSIPKALLAIAGLIVFLPGALLLGINYFNENAAETEYAKIAEQQAADKADEMVRTMLYQWKLVAKSVQPPTYETLPPTASIELAMADTSWQFRCEIELNVKTVRPAVGDDIVIQFFAKAELIPPSTSPEVAGADLTAAEEKMFCTVVAEGPSLFGDEYPTLSAEVGLDEPSMLGSMIAKPDSHGVKAMTIVSAADGAFANMQLGHHDAEIEVTRTRLGLPLVVEDWGAKAAFVLGPILTVPWWLDWISRRRKKSATKPRSNPLLSRIRRTGRG